jgi:hypothetical protein
VAKGNAIAAAILATGGKNPGTAAQLHHQAQFDVNQPYKPLPRPLEVFNQGQFGPMAPMQPMPVDVPREDSGRPDPRRAQYPVGWNLPTGQPGSEGLKLVPFAALRTVADAYSVARACVDHRVNEIVSMGWDIVPTVEQIQKMKGDPDLREDWEKRRRQVVDFFQHPDSDRAKYPTFEAWLTALLEDRFVIDAGAVHLRPPRRRGAGPFGSNLAALDLLDGSTIRPLLDMYGATPGHGTVAYQQYIWGVPRVDLTSVILGDDIAGLGDPAATFTSDQLIYLRDTTRAWTPYGFSCVEKAIKPITIGLLRQTYQEDYFTEGSVPASYITPGDSIATPQQMRQLQDALNALAGDVGAKHRIIVLPPGSKADPQKAIPLADQADEFIISQVSMPFAMTPMDLGVTPRVSAVQSPAETKQISDINTEKGTNARIKPVLNQLKADLFDLVIQRIFGQRDMEWYWGTPAEEEESNVGTHVQLTSNGLESIDEARISMGKNPWGLPETSVPGIKTATGYMPLTVAVQAAEASVAAAAGAPGAAGAPQLSGQPGQPKPPAVGAKPAQGQLPAAAAKPPVLSTPAHDAIRAATGTPPAAKDVTAELQKLQRFLRKGKPLEEFKTDILTAEALTAAGEALEKVGPKGYIHGWIFVGIPVVGAQVYHPHHGYGTVTGRTANDVHVKFDGEDHHRAFPVSHNPAHARLKPGFHPNGQEPGEHVELPGLGEPKLPEPEAPKTADERHAEITAHLADRMLKGNLHPHELSDTQLEEVAAELKNRPGSREVDDRLREIQAERDAREHPAGALSPEERQRKLNANLANAVVAGHYKLEQGSDAELAGIEHELAGRKDPKAAEALERVHAEQARRTAPEPVDDPHESPRSRAGEFSYENTRQYTDGELGELLGKLYSEGDHAAAQKIEEIIDRRESEGVTFTPEKFGSIEPPEHPTQRLQREGRKLTPRQHAAEEYDNYAQQQYNKALNDLNGVLLNEQGKAHARSGHPDLESEIFRGPIQVANRYASEELQQWWRENGRETGQSFRYGMYQWPTDQAAFQAVQSRGHGGRGQATRNDRSQF